MDTVQVSYGQYIFSPNPAAVTVKNRRTAVTEPLPGGGEWLTVTGTAPREVTLEGQLWAEDAAAALRRYEEPVSYTHLDVYKRQGLGTDPALHCPEL